MSTATISAASAPAEQIRVFAYAVPASVPVQKLAAKIELPVVTSDRKHVVLGEGQRWVVAQDFGALVVFGEVGELERRALEAWTSLRSQPGRPPTTEDFTIVVQPGAEPVAEFDRVVVPALVPRVVDVVGLVVGQSVALEHLETEVDEMIGKLEDHAETLRASGTFNARRRDLLKFIGAGMGLGNRAVLTLSLLDAPLISWNDEMLDHLHRGLREAFGIEERYRALDHKLGKVQGSLALMVDLIHQSRSVFLEVIVVTLIAVEIVLFFFDK